MLNRSLTALSIYEHMSNMEYVCSQMIPEFIVNERRVLGHNTNVTFHIILISNLTNILMP